MSNVVPFKRPEKRDGICSFCKKPEDQVKHLFSNGQEGIQLKCICNECVAHAKERMNEVE